MGEHKLTSHANRKARTRVFKTAQAQVKARHGNKRTLVAEADDLGRNAGVRRRDGAAADLHRLHRHRHRVGAVKVNRVRQRVQLREGSNKIVTGLIELVSYSVKLASAIFDRYKLRRSNCQKTRLTPTCPIIIVSSEKLAQMAATKGKGQKA